jgi:ATP-dependent Zn protease
MSQNYPTQPPYPVSNYAPVQKPTKAKVGLVSWVLIVVLAIVLYLILDLSSGSRQRLPLSDFRIQLLKGNISEIAIDGDSLRGSMGISGGGTTAFQTDLPTGVGGNWEFNFWLLEHAGNARVSVDNPTNLWSNILVPLIPWICIFLFIWLLLSRKIRKGKPAPVPVFMVAPPPDAVSPAPAPGYPPPPQPAENA